MMRGACALGIVLAVLLTGRAEADGDRKTVEKAPVAVRDAEPRSDASPPSTRAPRPEAVTLDAITIEGDIDVPQVLFITSRDRRDAPESLHELYFVDLAELGRLVAVEDLRWPRSAPVTKSHEE